MPARKYGAQPNTKNRRPARRSPAAPLSQLRTLTDRAPREAWESDDTRGSVGARRGAGHNGRADGASLGALDQPRRAVTTSRRHASSVLTFITKRPARGFIGKRQRMSRTEMELLAGDGRDGGELIPVDDGHPGVADGTAEEGGDPESRRPGLDADRFQGPRFRGET